MKSVVHELTGIALAAAAAACLTVTCAVAGTPAPANPAQPPPAAQKVRPLDLGPIIRPTDDPAKVEAAKQFIILFHPQTDPKTILKMVDMYLPRAIEAAKKTDPKLDVKKFEQEKRALYLGNGVRSLNDQAHVVSRHFTLEELKGMSAFFASTLGRKLTEEVPRITQEIRVAHRQEMMPKFGEKDDDGDAKSPPSKTPAKPPAPKQK